MKFIINIRNCSYSRRRRGLLNGSGSGGISSSGGEHYYGIGHPPLKQWICIRKVIALLPLKHPD